MFFGGFQKQQKQKVKKWQKGFTLVEVMIVLMVLLVLAGLTMKAIIPMITTRKNTTVVVSTMQSLQAAAEMYKNDIGVYPQTPQELWDKNAVPATYQSFWKGAYITPPAKTNASGDYIVSSPAVTFSFTRLTDASVPTQAQTGTSNDGYDICVKADGVSGDVALNVIKQFGHKVTITDSGGTVVWDNGTSATPNLDPDNSYTVYLPIYESWT